ncbi:MAG: DUF1559 domain-containing protein [Planctomycetota bacterium]|nr:DUF1559 domain-containing protein [Planctomycetota bacterium]MDA1177774.1 DUF1559 domain-containing protein [Planctomycetota bacterium]
MPYIEGQAIQDAGAVIAIGSVLPTMFCPSRRDQQVFDRSDKYLPALTGTRIKHAMTDYAAANRELTGIVQRFRNMKHADVLDGTSHTLLAADKRLNLDKLGQEQDDDNEGYTVGWNEDTIRKTSDPPEPDVFDDDSDGEKLFGSSHRAGINAAYVDGSVRSVGYDIDGKIFNASGAIEDGTIPQGS